MKTLIWIFWGYYKDKNLSEILQKHGIFKSIKFAQKSAKIVFYEAD